MQAGLIIEVLAGKTQIVLDRIYLDMGTAEREIGSLPGNGAGGGYQLLGGAEMVVDKIIDAGMGLVFLQGCRFSVKIYILPEQGAIKNCFGNKLAVQIIEIMDGRITDGLSYPPVATVVAVGVIA